MAAVAAVAGLLLAGCAPPDGIDGDLAGGWRELAEPVGWVPEAGTCHFGGYQRSTSLHEYEPVECLLSHETETVHVGGFTGDAAERVTPPPEGSPEWREAYSECDAAAAEYLGADFRDGALWLGVSVPAVAAWEGGARWFRCELVRFNLHEGTFGSHTGSLAGVLAREYVLRLGCYQAVADESGEFLSEMTPTGCDQPHNAEYVGVWPAPDVRYLDLEDEGDAAQVYRGCREQVAGYVDVPVQGVEFRTGTISTWISEQDWDNGDRGFRCYLWLDGEELTESLEGAGTSGLPVR